MSIQAQVYFAIIPEWILDADVSDKAIRLYGILNRYAREKQKCRLRRKTLAERLKVKDLKTVDRCVSELEEIGALRVRPRFRANDKGTQQRIANEYLLMVTAPWDATQQQLPAGGVGAENPPPPRGADSPGVGAEMPQQEREEQLKERTPSSSENGRSDVNSLCTLLADLIEGNGSRRPTVNKSWKDSARLMLDRDERSHEEAERLIRWCQANDFWRSTILSMPKFRAKYDTLRLQSSRASPNGRGPHRNPRTEGAYDGPVR